MRLRTALAVMIALGVLAVILAGISLAWAVGGSVAIAVGRAHGLLAALDTRLAGAYVSQLGGTDDATVLPTSRSTLDLFARGLTATVLEPYDGIEGGYYDARRGRVFGYAFPTHGGPRAKLDVPHVEEGAIVALARRSIAAGAPAATQLREGLGDVVALDARPLAVDGTTVGAAWTMERLSGAAAPAERRRRLVVVGIALVALALAGFGLFVLARLRRDVAALVAGVERLETDDDARIELGDGDLGAVGAAVNRMADVRFRARAVARRAEADALRAERLASLGRMVANVAHEVRNPLNAMRLQVALLQRREPAAADLAGRVVREIERLDAVVARMLELGTTGPARRTELDLRDVARRAVAVLEFEARERGVALALDLAGAPVPVAGDGAALEQIAINLLKNAVEASAEGATVEIGVDRRPALWVSNAGDPIPPERRGEIFEPFATTKPGGTGLGLSIAQEIAAWHEASLDVGGDAGRTVFTLRFAPRPTEERA